VATQKQRLAIFDTRAPVYAMPLRPAGSRLLPLGIETDSSQMFLRGQGQGERRPSPGLIGLLGQIPLQSLEAMLGRWRGMLRRLADVNALEQVYSRVSPEIW